MERRALGTLQLLQLAIVLAALAYFARSLFRRPDGSPPPAGWVALATVAVGFDPLISHFAFVVHPDALAMAASAVLCGAFARIVGGVSRVWVPAGLLLFALPGWLLLQAGAKVAKIDLARDELRFVLRFGIFFYRRVRLRRRGLARATFSCRLQGLLSMELGQQQPEVVLTLKRHSLLRSDRRMFLNCSLEAATWIVGGLRAWQELNDRGEHLTAMQHVR